MNNTNIGILAHVDAGKTTLSEAILCMTGVLKNAGRVDHGDAFLDTFSLEKERGITIFSKQALFSIHDRSYTIVDTPGHADFSPETERVLNVLDCAILVISAADSVTGQVHTLWKLLTHYKIPTIIFVNKMDQPGSNHDAVLSDLQKELESVILDFSPYYNWKSNDIQIGNSSYHSFLENIAMCDDTLLEQYLAGYTIDEKDITKLFSTRKLFPCFFGSALKMQGIKQLSDFLYNIVPIPCYGNELGGKIYKISHDIDKTRLTWLKVTGGILNVKDILHYSSKGKAYSEKINQIRIYSGADYSFVTECPAGSICAVTGLTSTSAGQVFGFEKLSEPYVLEPVLTCSVIAADDIDRFLLRQNLITLAEEEPLMHVMGNEQTDEISIQVMGHVQMELIQYLMLSRFNQKIEFGSPSTVYKETIAAPVEGVGHFEPLRHYAEVHLMLEPSERDTGITFSSSCPVDILAINWQKLILSSLEEKRLCGVLTGSELTDIHITLVTGKSSIKHTEGGDFAEAACRAVRQGLMMTESILLEPVYSCQITIPSKFTGRIMSDIQTMQGTFDGQEDNSLNCRTTISCSIPAACLGNYPSDILSRTNGEGHISFSLKGYEPCHNSEEISGVMAYDPDADTANPSSSVFCSHGVGTLIPWNQVRDHMHVESKWKPEELSTVEDNEGTLNNCALKPQSCKCHNDDMLSFKERALKNEASEKELAAIFERTYGPVKQRYVPDNMVLSSTSADSTSNSALASDAIEKDGLDNSRYSKKTHTSQPVNTYILIDGYNILYASDELKALAVRDLKAARDRLTDIISNFQGFRREKVMLIYDAYKVAGGQEHIENLGGLTVVYTKEAETADQYIEKASHELNKHYRVYVATSDAVEQVIIYGSGAIRLSARDFWADVRVTENEIREHISKTFK